jgi:hypothetical protein
MEKMKKKPEGKFHKKAVRAGQLVTIFTDAIRSSRLAQEPV